MVSIIAGVLMALCLSAPAAAAFLEREILTLDMSGNRSVKTSLALEPEKQYFIRLESPHYDLHPVWGHLSSCRCVRYLLHIDGQAPSDKDKISPWGGRHMTEITWQWWGRGMPISLAVAKDLTSEIRFATVEVSRVQDPPPPPSPPPPPPTPPPPKIVRTEPSPAGDVLARAVFPLSVSGWAVRTDLPLQAGRLFHLRIHSPHDLRSLWNTLRSQFRIQVDGEPLTPAMLAKPWDPSQEVRELVFIYRGRDDFLTLQLTGDVSARIPEASVEIVPAPKPPPLPPPKQRHTWVWLSLLGVGVLITALIVRGRSVNRIRRARIRGRINESLRMKAEAEAQCQREEQARQQAEQRAFEAREAAERQRRAQEELEKRAIAWAQWAELERNFLVPEFQQQFAAKHLRSILDMWKDHWFQECQDVKNDEMMRTLLAREYPIALEVLEARLEVYRIARRLEVAPSPVPEKKPRLTPEEHKARIEGVRSRMVQKDDVKAMDFMARRLRKLEREREYAELLRQLDLDEDEFERELQRFRDEQDMLGDDEENPNGHKTV